MKVVFLLIAALLPLPAFAVKLADCDHEPYDVLVNNAGQTHMVHMTRDGGEIEELGPLVSFQIQGKEHDKDHHPVITATDPTEEFCIWSGRIQVQRLSTQGAAPGAFSLR